MPTPDSPEAGSSSPATLACPTCGLAFDATATFCPEDGARLAPRASADTMIGTKFAGRYLIERRLGVGGMGSVYLGTQEHAPRRVAVKVIREGAQFDPDAVQRLFREAENAGSFIHTHVATIYESGVSPEGRAYIVMEFVDGPTLTKLLVEHGALPPRRALAIAWQVCDGLSFAHERGIVHRDLKPENIMLMRRRDGSDLVKVVDFGISRIEGLESQQVTATGFQAGTPRYMSPEQLMGGTVDERADIYALGIIVQEMLTGRHPWDTEEMRLNPVARLTTPPQPLAAQRPEVQWPDSVQDVVSRALAVAQDQRYRTVIELRSELARAILEWIPDDPAASEPWNAQFQYAAPMATPPAVRAVEVEPRSDPETPVPSPPLPPPPLPAPWRRRAVLATGAIFIAFAAWRLSRGPAPAEFAVDPAKAVAGDPRTSGQGAAANDTQPGDPPPDSGSARGPVDSNPAPPDDPGLVRRPTLSAAAVRPRLDSLARLTDVSVATPATARRALRLATALQPDVVASADRVELAYRQVEAHLILDDAPAACAILRRIEQPSATTRFGDAVANYLGNAQLGCRR